MAIFKEQFTQAAKRLIPKKGNVIPLIISLSITLFFFLGFHFLGNYFPGILWIIIAVIFGLLMLFIMTVAGFAVIKSLFFVAAELSLLIFLAQSYCGLPNHSIAGDTALKSLLALGILYIIIKFFSCLLEALNGNYKKVESKRWSSEKVIVISLYLIFTVMVIWQIYRVVGPIVLNLCVYK